MLGTGSYRTAWYMCHRIRAAMQDGSVQRLTGEIEVDETYIGGKSTSRHAGQKPSKKTAVIGAIARKGNVVCNVIEKTTKAKMEEFVTQAVGERVIVADIAEVVVVDEAEPHRFRESRHDQGHEGEREDDDGGERDRRAAPRGHAPITLSQGAREDPRRARGDGLESPAPCPPRGVPRPSPACRSP